MCALALGTALLSMSQAAFAVEASRAFGRRTATKAFAERCNLLSSEEMRALESGRLQARGSLLRSGANLADVNAQESASIASVAGLPCDQKQALAEVNSLRGAFASWENERRQEYRGTERSWTAERNSASRERQWHVEQVLLHDDERNLSFGLTGLDGKVSLDLISEGGLTPRSAVLRMRDPDKLDKPLSPFMRKLLKIPGTGLASMAPPDSASMSFFAAERIPAARTLLHSEKRNARGTRFIFEPKALEAFAALDPRETAVLDLYWSSGLGKPDRVQRLYVEVGDFQAARLFAGDLPVTN